MSSNADRTQVQVQHSDPIPIHHRSRSHSVSETSSSDESSSPHSPVSPISSPLSGNHNQPRIAGTSGVLNYFLSQSPKSPTATFPFRRGFGAAVFEDDSEPDLTAPPSTKHRRASTAAWPSSPTSPTSPSSFAAPQGPQQQDRAVGLLRRLSLGGAALKPPMPPTRTLQPPPNTPAVERGPSPPPTPGRKPRRANTLAAGAQRPKRAPSPMGERILTGHFDGFN
ncbi:hypothetical protein BDW22DRAFT_136514 [Trametopsis cervina]|nr:hypothetical protein BDW22DRAFT_136514 [Trametopsis cervina]